MMFKILIFIYDFYDLSFLVQMSCQKCNHLYFNMIKNIMFSKLFDIEQ